MKVSIDKLTADMILKYDLYTDNGELILTAGTILDASYIKRISALGFVAVDVLNDQKSGRDSALIAENRTMEKAYKNAVESFKSIYQTAARGERIHNEAVDEISTPIVDQVLNNSSITRQLWVMNHIDKYAFEHSVMVGIISGLVAKWLGYSTAMITQATTAGLLHDIGKVYVADALLEKTGRLTDDERKAIQSHVLRGYNLLRDQSDFPDEILQAVLHHHEQYDGSGYPHGLKGELIPLLARIVAVANHYANMTTSRRVGGHVNPYLASEVIGEMAFKSLDPMITTTFVEGISNFFVGNVVQLSDGQVGEVILINRVKPTRPLIKTETDFIDLGVQKGIEIIRILH